LPFTVKIALNINTIAVQNLASANSTALKRKEYDEHQSCTRYYLQPDSWEPEVLHGFLGLRRGYVTWIGLSRSPCDPTAQITLVQKAGSAEPQPNMTIEVDDVDAVHAKAVGLGLQVVYPLTDEPWGVRRFFVTDPNSEVINVMSHHKRVGEF
jgi:uncharacterized glyoxalase superfamily protein PhnB